MNLRSALGAVRLRSAALARRAAAAPDFSLALTYVVVTALLRAHFVWLGDGMKEFWRVGALSLLTGAVEDAGAVLVVFGLVPGGRVGARFRAAALALGVFLTVVNLSMLGALNVPFDPLMVTYLADPLRTREIQSPVPLVPLFVRLFAGWGALAVAWRLSAPRRARSAAPYRIAGALTLGVAGAGAILVSRGVASIDHRVTQVSHADGFAWLWFQLGTPRFGARTSADPRHALLTPAAVGSSEFVSDRYPLARGSGYALCHAGLRHEGCDVDADGDGVTLTDDCNDRDPGVHPGALDPGGDGVDQDCSGLDANAPDVLVLELEGLPARVLAATGARGPDVVAERLGALAARPDARLFTHYETAAAQTAPGFASAMCSLLPHYGAGITREYADRHFRCLPGVLGSLGYDTRMVQNGDPRFDNQGKFAQKAGFAAIESASDIERALGHAERVSHWGVVDASLFAHLADLLGARKPSDPPLFLLAQSITNHHPFILPDPKFLRPGPGGEIWQKVRSTSAYVDDALGNFVATLDAIARRPGRRPLLVAMSGDHGHPKELHPGNRAPTSGLYDENVHTPLVLWAPGQPARLVRFDATDRTAPCSSLDLMPTLLGLIGADPITASMGRDLGRASAEVDQRAVALNPLGGGLVRLRRTAGSVVVRALPPALEAYAAADADEQDDLGDRAPFARAEADEALDAVFAAKALIEADRVWSDSLLPKPASTLARIQP
ncbi:MAG TPA: sulfatase-like hydrolase/transferase [Polyangiaceae bacterium]|jgi:hypothetical protein|nr:sulfatase-like hydrolase/transferase [Polyangiaceae bacterium]